MCSWNKLEICLELNFGTKDDLELEEKYQTSMYANEEFKWARIWECKMLKNNNYVLKKICPKPIWHVFMRFWQYSLFDTKDSSSLLVSNTRGVRGAGAKQTLPINSQYVHKTIIYARIWVAIEWSTYISHGECVCVCVIFMSKRLWELKWCSITRYYHYYHQLVFIAWRYRRRIRSYEFDSFPNSDHSAASFSILTWTVQIKISDSLSSRTKK